MKIVPQVDGVVYPSLMGLVAYVEFPAVLPRSAILAASRGGATTGLPTDPSLIGIFVGQVPFSLPPGYLAWFVNTLLGEECVQEALMARNQSCGRVVLPVDRAQTVLLLSETALFDSTGVWISRTPEQTQLLAQFCASLGQGQFGSQVLRHALPKKCAVLRLQHQPRQQPISRNQRNRRGQRVESHDIAPPAVFPVVAEQPQHFSASVASTAAAPVVPHYHQQQPAPQPVIGNVSFMHYHHVQTTLNDVAPMSRFDSTTPPYPHYHHHHHHHGFVGVPLLEPAVMAPLASEYSILPLSHQQHHQQHHHATWYAPTTPAVAPGTTSMPFSIFSAPPPPSPSSLLPPPPPPPVSFPQQQISNVALPPATAPAQHYHHQLHGYPRQFV